jgi:hypothetical protein
MHIVFLQEHNRIAGNSLSVLTEVDVLLQRGLNSKRDPNSFHPIRGGYKRDVVCLG